MNGLNVLNVGDARAIDRLPGARKLWIMVLLLAIRDRASHVGLRSLNGKVQLFLGVGGDWNELVPPPPALFPKMAGIILEWGGKSTKHARRAGLFRRRLPGPDPLAALPWEVRFRVRVGSGQKDVAAKAAPIDGGFELILSLVDISITSQDAEAVLRELFHLRRGRETGGGVPDAEATG